MDKNVVEKAGEKSEEKSTEDADILAGGGNSSLQSPVNVYAGRAKLRFVAQLERSFQASYARQYAQYMRVSLTGLCFLFAVSGVFDFLLLNGDIQVVWLLRYAICLPLLLVVILFAMTRYFMAYQQLVLSIAILIAVIAMALMMSNLPNAEGQYYLTGLLIIQMAGLNILRLQFRYALVCTFLIPILGFAIELWYDHFFLEKLFIELYFYASVSVLSLVSNFFLERAARRDYIQKRLLHREQKQLQEANDHLKILVTSDALTGIANRRHFDEALLEEWRRAKRTNYPLSLLMIDIDFFKAYNDCYGHQQGDECLKRVAKILDYFGKRPGDLVARYGGEEFGVILPGTNAIDAHKIAKQICKSVRARKLVHEKSEICEYVTVSIGVASSNPFHLNCCDELIKLADQALYKAKGLGRNQVAVCSDY